MDIGPSTPSGGPLLSTPDVGSLAAGAPAQGWRDRGGRTAGDRQVYCLIASATYRNGLGSARHSRR